jgi:hypothetical protein
MPRASSTTISRIAVEPALVLLLPWRRALEAVGGAHVVDEVTVDDRDGGLVVDVLDEQLGVPWGEPAVAADVDVPAVVGGDEADVLAARLGALAGTAGDPSLILCGDCAGPR